MAATQDPNVESEDAGLESLTSAPSDMPLAPVLGYRNYWYPLIEARRVGSKPVAVRLLGEDLVLFRTSTGVAALVDRCPHRGSRLSQGRVRFPDTVSCPYHGWTYNAAGECVAAIVEGPASNTPGTVRVRSFPTEERRGVVWVFIGEMEPPPLDEDLPFPLSDPQSLPHFYFEDWHCDWRNVTENYPDMLHAPFVHRTSPEMVLQKLPAWGTVVMELSPDRKGMRVRGPGAAIQAEYPGVGVFPRRKWFRVFSRRGASGVGAEVRMPGYIVLPARRDPVFGHDVAAVQWPVPVDEHTTRIFECALTKPGGPLQRVWQIAWWQAYYRHVHGHFFTHQDRRIIEQQTHRESEHLSSSDAALIQWRRFAAKMARRP